jgi:alanine racemase
MTTEPYALINLKAIRQNVKKVREFAPNAKIVAVIKANGYGHGLLSMAQALNNVDGLAIARISEGVFLRKSGVESKLLILSGFFSERQLNDIVEYSLDVVVHSVQQVEILKKYLGQTKISIWLKINTGMNRLGLSPAEFVAAYQELTALPNIKQPITLMTHLSSADDMKSPVTQQQIQLFNKTVENISDEKSIANSAGIIGWPDSVTNWVRPGLMLYGVSPFLKGDGQELGLNPVMSLHSHIIAVKNIAAGESVGYSGNWVSKKQTRLGIVCIGYGDGYPRHAKEGTPVLVNNERVPLIGRVSMDMITVDLSSQKNVIPGDPVTLWGDGLTVEEIAKYADTIPYTLLCGITQRIKFSYVTG